MISTSGSAATVPETTSLRVLLVRAGTRICALPLGCVAETMRLLPIRPVAGAPEAVRGISMVRGVATPIVDLAALLGDGEDPHAARLVAIRTGNRQVGLVVRSVLRIAGIPRMDALPPLLQEVCAARVQAIAALDQEFLWVLDAARLISGEMLDLPRETEA